MILSGALVLPIHAPIPDLIVGMTIGLYVINEAVNILRGAREARSVAAGRS